MKKVEAMREMQRKASELWDPQGASLLLTRTMDACKVGHLMRTQHPNNCGEAFAVFDKQLRHAMQTVLGQAFTDAQWDVISLGEAAGGHGARKTTNHSLAANLGSLNASREFVNELLTSIDVKATKTMCLNRSLTFLSFFAVAGVPAQNGTQTGTSIKPLYDSIH